jgi:hypothetical protein
MKVGISKVAAILIATVSLLELGGCATQPLARVSGPAEAQAISVALVGQSCDRENDPNWSSADILGLDLRIRVGNAGAAELTFDSAQTALLAAGQPYRPHRSDPPAAIPPGASRTFVVHFLERNGSLACDVPMSLAIDRAVTAAGATVTFEPISFLASNNDS